MDDCMDAGGRAMQEQLPVPQVVEGAGAPFDNLSAKQSAHRMQR